MQYPKQKNQIRILSTVLALVLCITAVMTSLALPAAALDLPSTPYTENAVIYNIDFGTVMYEENADAPVYPAGTVKIMTALIALEHFNDTGEKITVTEEMLADAAGSSTGFEPGEILTAEQILAALIISNANDAAHILAFAVAGNTESFVELMNSRAAEIGMENTVYTNVSGLHDPGMTTTARDVMLVSAEVLKYRLYEDLASTASYIIPATNLSAERTLRNRNYFVSSFYNLNYYRESVSGMSCSYTGEAGTCLSLTGANSEGLRFIAVVMGANEPAEPEDGVIYACEDALELLSWAYSAYDHFTLVGTGDLICEIPVSLSSGVDYVIALPSEKITAFLPADTDLSAELRIDYTLTSESLAAPVVKGQIVGSLTAYVGDLEVGSVDLIAKNNVDRSMWLSLLAQITGIFTHPIVIALIVLAVLLVILYVILMAVHISRRNNRVRYKKRK